MALCLNKTLDYSFYIAHEKKVIASKVSPENMFWKISSIAVQQEKSGTRRNCNMKKLEHKKASRKQCNTEKEQHEKSAAQENCNMKKVRQEKSAWRKNLQHEESAAWRKYEKIDR